MIAEPMHLHLMQAPPTSPGRPPTEEEAELLEYDRTHGVVEGGVPYEQGTVFGLAGAGSALVVLLFGWVIFKRLWFGWLGMPGWW